MKSINYVGILVGAIVYTLLGMIWYSPFLFGDRFMALMGWPAIMVDSMVRNLGTNYVFAILSSLIMVFILDLFIEYTQVKRFIDGMKIGLLLWLGFVATTNLSTVIFENRLFNLYLINIAYEMVCLALIGGMLAVWKRK